MSITVSNCIFATILSDRDWRQSCVIVFLSVGGISGVRLHFQLPRALSCDKLHKNKMAEEELTVVSSNVCYGGYQKVFSHKRLANL